MTNGGMPLIGASFLDLLPDSIRNDPEIAAAAMAVDVALAGGDATMNDVLIWSRIDDLEEPLLSNLARQMHIEGYEGWHMATTLTQKRNLIKVAYIMHFHKGTPYSLKRVFEILEMRGKPIEWFQEPWDPDFHSYEFDMDVETSRPVDDDFHREMLGLIYELKNERSHLRKARLVYTVHDKKPKIGSACLSDVVIHVRPFYPEDVEYAPTSIKAAGAMQYASICQLFPMEQREWSIAADIPKTGGGLQIMSAVRLQPLEDETNG